MIKTTEKICTTCGIYRTTSRYECNLCGYKRRNKIKLEEIISNGFWNEKELDNIIYSILYQKYPYINIILKLINRNKTLEDLMDLISNHLKIGGQTPVKVKVKCDMCHKLLLLPIKKALTGRNYCNMKCRNLYKSTYLKGDRSPSYQKIDKNCDNCNKPIKVIPWELKRKNSFGESNNFCCQECYWEFRSKHYVKDKNHNYGLKFSKERRLLQSEITTKRITSGEFPQVKTKPHIKINDILDDLNIKFTNEYNLKYYALDIYLNDFNLGIEIMGDYWHSNPVKYKKEDLSLIQTKGVNRDKSKHTYTLKYYKFETLYLWEYDINNNIEMCKYLIKKYIELNGNLKDFNSFNYYVSDNRLILKSELIKPYFIK